jgi:hypothetical protein
MAGEMKAYNRERARPLSPRISEVALARRILQAAGHGKSAASILLLQRL